MSNFDEKVGEMFETFDEILAEDDCEISAAEFQGILSGMISAGFEPKNLSWQGTLIEVVNNGQSFSITAQKVITEVLNESYLAFTDEDFLAPILIPADNFPLIDRLEAMALWCQGYLLGIGLQLAEQKIESPEVSESLQDISEISQMEIVHEDDEDSQNSIEILLEHLKVAVKVIYLDLVVKHQLTDIKSSQVEPTYH